MTVGLVADGEDALDLFVANQTGEIFLHSGLVDLKRQLGDDDRIATVHLFELDLGADDDAPAAGGVGLEDAVAPLNDAAGRKVRPRNVRHQLRQRDLAIQDQRQHGVDDLYKVVRRDFRSHADGDALGTVDEQVGVRRRKNLGLLGLSVEIGLEVDGLFIEIAQQLFSSLGHSTFGVPVRSGVIPVHTTKVALTVDQQVPHIPRLRHANERVVHRGVSVGMVLLEHLTDDACALRKTPIGNKAFTQHGVKHATVNRLQTIPHVRQSPPHDDRHRIIEIRRA